MIIFASLKILQCESVSLEIKVDQLSDRLSLLDSKISLDLVSLRQDLQDVGRSISDITSDRVCSLLYFFSIDLLRILILALT